MCLDGAGGWIQPVMGPGPGQAPPAITSRSSTNSSLRRLCVGITHLSMIHGRRSDPRLIDQRLEVTETERQNPRRERLRVQCDAIECRRCLAQLEAVQKSAHNDDPS